VSTRYCVLLLEDLDRIKLTATESCAPAKFLDFLVTRRQHLERAASTVLWSVSLLCESIQRLEGMYHSTVGWMTLQMMHQAIAHDLAPRWDGDGVN
jgi:hypothetical protein